MWRQDLEFHYFLIIIPTASWWKVTQCGIIFDKCGRLRSTSVDRRDTERIPTNIARMIIDGKRCFVDVSFDFFFTYYRKKIMTDDILRWQIPCNLSFPTVDGSIDGYPNYFISICRAVSQFFPLFFCVMSNLQRHKKTDLSARNQRHIVRIHRLHRKATWNTDLRRSLISVDFTIVLRWRYWLSSTSNPIMSRVHICTSLFFSFLATFGLLKTAEHVTTDLLNAQPRCRRNRNYIQQKRSVDLR